MVRCAWSATRGNRIGWAITRSRESGAAIGCWMWSGLGTGDIEEVRRNWEAALAEAIARGEVKREISPTATILVTCERPIS
jgi:hypothetical protein